jgi:hypothetical protein
MVEHELKSVDEDRAFHLHHDRGDGSLAQP